MTTSKKIASNAAIQLMGKIVSTILGLAAVAIMTRTLGVEKFGWYVTATGFLQFVGIISDFGFTVTTANMLAEPAFNKARLFNTLFTWRFITAVIFQAAAPVIILLFPYPSEVKTAVLITSLSFFAIAVNQVFIGYYQANLKTHIQTIGEVLGRLVLVVGVAVVGFTDKNFLLVMGVITIASLTNTLFLILRHGSVEFTIDKPISQALFTKMWPTALSVICNAFYLQGDRVILPLYASQTIVGYYGAAYRVLDITIQIAAMIMGIIMPLVTYAWSRQNIPEFKKFYQLSLDLVSFFLIPITAGIFVLHTPLMVFIAGKEFTAASPILTLLSISIFGTCFGMAFGHVCLAINKQRQALVIYLTDALLSIIGYFIFIPRYGAYGAIGVTIFSEFYAGILLLSLAIFHTRFAPKLYTFSKIILASAGMGGVLTLFPDMPLPVSLLIGTLTYGTLAFALRIFSIPMLKELVAKERIVKPELF
jgi:O-antigen/teichoic acid export membrane protein